MMLHALAIEPDAHDRRAVRHILNRDGWRVCEAASVAEAMRVIESCPVQLIFCDTYLATQRVNPAASLSLLSAMMKAGGAKAHIVITAVEGCLSNPLEVILNGAADYIRKPFQEAQISGCARAVIARLEAAEREAKCPNYIHSPEVLEPESIASKFVGGSKIILNLFKEIAAITNSTQLDDKQNWAKESAQLPQPTIFITGETGTGKELIAQLIHQHSSLLNGRFIPINCSNLSADLVESELFGHVPGAFTGALKEKVGLWELADGGTLFLDEITEAPRSVLPKLLRVLQDGLVRRVGANSWKQTRVRVIAASNRDMQAEIGAGRFRADLYHRLSLHKLHAPPLRERPEDIPLIVEHLARRHCRRPMRFSQEALGILMGYSFPGNVRELENIVRRAARKSPDGIIYAIDLCSYMELAEEPANSGSGCAPKSEGPNPTASNVSSLDESLDKQLHRFKLQLVKETLSRHNGNATRAARALKISRPSLYKLLKDIKREEVSMPDTKRDLTLGLDHEGQCSFAAGVSQ